MKQEIKDTGESSHDTILKMNCHELMYVSLLVKTCMPAFSLGNAVVPGEIIMKDRDRLHMVQQAITQAHFSSFITKYQQI